MHRLKLLHQTGLLTTKGVITLIKSLSAEGISLTALLGYSARRFPERIAVQDDRQRMTWAELYSRTRHLAGELSNHYHLAPGKKVALCCCNHAELLTALFACASTGADLCLLNVEMSSSQWAAQVKKQRFDLIIHDPELASRINDSGYRGARLPIGDDHGIGSHQQRSAGRRVAYRAGSITVLTSGSTGDFKSAARKPSLSAFLNPFFSLLDKLQLSRYRSLYIATPVYHGFGLATVCLAVLLGATIYLRRRFDARSSAALIARHRIEVVTLVPLMLSRMIHDDAGSLSSLRCIISGGAPLSPVLVRETQARLPGTLFNLYGTSEAGICLIATPDDLKRAPDMAGRPVHGLTLDLRDRLSGKRLTGVGERGEIVIQCAWSTQGNNIPISTGDLAWRNASGDYFLCGRMDDMIVSAGENVYPLELETVLMTHPAVRECLVAGVDDAEFGQRLKAWVTLKGKTDNVELLAWLKPRVARYLMPVDLQIIDDIPLTAVGKPDVRRLTR